MWEWGSRFGVAGTPLAAHPTPLHPALLDETPWSLQGAVQARATGCPAPPRGFSQPPPIPQTPETGGNPLPFPSREGPSLRAGPQPDDQGPTVHERARGPPWGVERVERRDRASIQAPASLIPPSPRFRKIRPARRESGPEASGCTRATRGGPLQGGPGEGAGTRLPPFTRPLIAWLLWIPQGSDSVPLALLHPPL